MKKTFFALGFSILLFSCEKTETKNTELNNHNHQSSENKNEMALLMDQMMNKMHTPKSTGNNDADFSNMMIEHHIGAVEMSELLLSKGKDAELKAFAQKVIDAQTKEIEVMKKFQNKTELSPDTKEFQQALNQSMGAMMNKEIKIYNNIDSNFAAQMIPHHQSAVEMAKAYLKFGKEPELMKLCEEIIQEQNIESAQLQSWLAKK